MKTKEFADKDAFKATALTLVQKLRQDETPLYEDFRGIWVEARAQEWEQLDELMGIFSSCVLTHLCPKGGWNKWWRKANSLLGDAFRALERQEQKATD